MKYWLENGFMELKNLDPDFFSSTMVTRIWIHSNDTLFTSTYDVLFVKIKRGYNMSYVFHSLGETKKTNNPGVWTWFSY